ncbi:hypothetical protein EC973_005472 [Apophysomyces ossiformis]|uniref:Endonuclease/exonuclease/phosphatase domain-containing protein n=1 Tax=Apophysomyces ossiformis TaxID=679940 RepID=A0A8H7EUS8_9FUNG|nr:hypothetical protein EC973_005472 [Apophysomyces ossiformis]
MIVEDIAQYEPDIMCLQEVDNYDEFYKESFSKLGHATKQHGCMIGYKATKFERAEYATLDYDSDTLAPATQQTGNIAQLIGLRFVDLPKGLVIGNTHLYWRPQSFYERMRQTAIYMRRLDEFKSKLGSVQDGRQWSSLLIGGMYLSDFNTAPIDATYAAIQQNPLTAAQLETLHLSRRSFGGEESNPDETGCVGDSEETSLMSVSDLMELFTEGKKWRSVYSQYSDVGKAASDVYGEPKFTHYAAMYCGTLDYIFADSDKHQVLELLEMPEVDKNFADEIEFFAQK